MEAGQAGICAAPGRGDGAGAAAGAGCRPRGRPGSAAVPSTQMGIRRR